MSSVAPPRRRDPTGRFKKTLFLRLRWKIFGDLSKIQVEDGLDEDGLDKNGTQKLTPFLSHPIAEESIAEPQVTVAHVSSGDLAYIAIFRIGPYGWKYKGFTIEDTDGQPITAKDVITKVHEHLNEPFRKQLILATEQRLITNQTGTNPLYSIDMTNPQIFMEHVHAQTLDNRASLDIPTFTIGQLGISAEESGARRKANRLGY